MKQTSSSSSSNPRTPLNRSRLPALVNSPSMKGDQHLLIPVSSTITTFYPQSLWAEQQQGKTDTDKLTANSVYFLPRSKVLEVGKYVPDPKNRDYSNPKFELPSGAYSNIDDLRRALKDFTTDDDDDDDDSNSSSSDSSSESEEEKARRRRPVASSAKMVPYTTVQPVYPCSSASIFFPIYFSRPSAKEKSDPRGTPADINDELHPNDRADVKLTTVSSQENNLNRMLLFKIGPGAVAFKVVINAFVAGGMAYTPSNRNFNILWAKRATPYTLATLNPYQKVNHFPGTWGIGRKDNLAVNINEMKRHYGSDVFDIIPASFILPRQQSDVELDASHNPGTSTAPLIYILKPVASSCGRGIHLCSGIPPPVRNGKKMVCQRYIGNPFLIFGRKFDLRLYCVVTSFDPLRIYLFDEGLVRFAAEKYAGPDKNLENIQMHLTNYSVNKTAELNKKSRGKDYESDDPLDIKWCLSDFKKHLQSKHPDGLNAWRRIQQECDDVVIKTFLSIETQVITKIRSECSDRTGRCCFELYGLDIMVDSNLKARLIEVNIMPSLATGTSLDTAVKSRMLAHMLTLIRAVPFVRSALPDKKSPSGVFVPKGAQPSRPERMYKFGHHPLGSFKMLEKPLLRAFQQDGDDNSMLSPEETLMLIEAEEELRCAGGFRCIYPNPTTVEKYLPLFPGGVRRNNYLLASAVTQRMRVKVQQ